MMTWGYTGLRSLSDRRAVELCVLLRASCERNLEGTKSEASREKRWTKDDAVEKSGSVGTPDVGLGGGSRGVSFRGAG